MTNKTITLARVRAADSLYLTMWPNDTLHECETGNPKWNACLNAIDAGYTKEVSAALADPVPPAGGEVLAWRVTGTDATPSVVPCVFLERPGVWSYNYTVTELVDRAHVTRLQAEVERLTAQKADAVAVVDETDDGLFIEIIYGDDGSSLRRGDKLYTAPSDRGYVSRLAYDALQSELTKALELLEDMRGAMRQYEKDCDEYPPFHHNQMTDRVDTYLANQSAPADKGQCESVACAHGIRAPHACDQCEAQNAVPDYWEDPDTGTCIDQWSKIQGLNGTEAYSIPLYRHAEQPAPVAVVIPERAAKDGAAFSSQLKVNGWNACLDEIARLNSEPKP